MKDQTLILAPLPLELQALVEGLTSQAHQFRLNEINRLKIYEFQDLKLLCAVGGYGKTQFGIHTQFFLHHLKDIKQVLCVGAAGSLANEVSVGDVVVAEKTVEHDFKVRFVKQPSPEFCGDANLINHFRQISTQKFRIHFGTVASGDEDIVEIERAKDLQKQTGALAVAWEGAGGARACKFNNIPYLEIRGITDTADHQATRDFQSNLKLAMDHIAKLLGTPFFL